MPSAVRSSSVRSSAVQSNAGPSTEAPADATPPPYEPPTFPLSPLAQRSLTQLLRLHSLKKLEEGLEDAQKLLLDSAGDINDRLTNRTALVKKVQSGDIQIGEDDGPLGSEESLDQLRDKVESMTQRLDSNLRKLIDGRQSVQSLNANIQSIMDNAQAHASTQTSSFTTRSRLRLRADVEADANEASQDMPEDFTPTDPAGGTQQPQPPLEVFRSRLEHDTTRYQSYSRTARYGEDDAYRSFKQIVHDAHYPDDESVPLPHYSKWFQDGPTPAPGVRLPAATMADEDEDDIAVSKATISTKCPITLRELETPFTSRKCPHTFEAKVIVGMIAKSKVKVFVKVRGRQQAAPAVQCPATGCDQQLSKYDLYEDAVLTRKIRRIQRAKQIQEEEGDSDGEEIAMAGTQRLILDDTDDNDDDNRYVDDLVQDESSRNPKSEPRGTSSIHDQGDDSDVMYE